MEFFQFRAKNIRQYDWPTGISIDTHRSTGGRGGKQSLQRRHRRVEKMSTQSRFEATNLDLRRVTDGLKVSYRLCDNDPRQIFGFIIQFVQNRRSNSQSCCFYIAQRDRIIDMIVRIKIRKPNRDRAPETEESRVFKCLNSCSIRIFL